MHVANQPAPRDVAHDVLDRPESQGGIRLVVHRQKDAGDNLNHQNQKRERAKNVPEVEVLRCVVLAHVLVVKLAGGETVVNPVQQLGAYGRIGGNFF